MVFEFQSIISAEVEVLTENSSTVCYYYIFIQNIFNAEVETETHFECQIFENIQVIYVD